MSRIPLLSLRSGQVEQRFAWKLKCRRIQFPLRTVSSSHMLMVSNTIASSSVASQGCTAPRHFVLSNSACIRGDARQPAIQSNAPKSAWLEKFRPRRMRSWQHFSHVADSAVLIVVKEVRKIFVFAIFCIPGPLPSTTH